MKLRRLLPILLFPPAPRHFRSNGPVDKNERTCSSLLLGNPSTDRSPLSTSPAPPSKAVPWGRSFSPEPLLPQECCRQQLGVAAAPDRISRTSAISFWFCRDWVSWAVWEAGVGGDRRGLCFGCCQSRQAKPSSAACADTLTPWGYKPLTKTSPPKGVYTVCLQGSK